MLCTSILSEVVLGFMLWSGWLGSMQATEAPQSDYTAAAGQSYETVPVGRACPQACVEYAPPVVYPQVAPAFPVSLGDILVSKIESLPPHLAACDCKDVFNTGASTSLSCKKPCFWKIYSAVKSRSANGIEVEITLDANNDGVQELYKARKSLVFDAPTTVTLTGNHAEPATIQVVARRVVPNLMLSNQPIQQGPPSWGVPVLPMPVATPTLPPILPQVGIVGAAPRSIPDPIPLFPPSSGYTPPMPVITPANFTLPAPTPVHHASVRLVYESGKARLSVKSQGMTSECIRMKLETGAVGAVRLSAGKNHVHLAGTKWKAEADRVEFGDDGRIVLAGHVKLTSDKLGVCAAVKADRLCVQVKGGKFEKIIETK